MLGHMSGVSAHIKVRLAQTCLFAAALFFHTVAHAAPADSVPPAFRGESEESDFSILYDDLTAILQQSVLVTGRSDRARASRARPAAASHIIRRSSSHYSLEGNRVLFDMFVREENRAMLSQIRQSLEAVPDQIPLHLLNRREQLAYWLNLYNVTVLEQIAAIYPEARLKKHYQGKDALWDRKLVTVSGMALSLNDIHHRILIPKFQDPLIMYGLFQGFAGGPNIRNEAYSGKHVMTQLRDNAEEFINSNRGMHRRDRLLKISHLYEVNAALFPNFSEDVRTHLMRYADTGYRDRIKEASPRLAASVTNFAIADVHDGYKGRGSTANTNSAAFLGAIRAADYGSTAAGHFGDSTYIANNGGALASGVLPGLQAQSTLSCRFPAHVVDYLMQMEERRRKNREGDVSVEEVDEGDAS